MQDVIYPKVSVVMPVYNRAYCIQHAVRSIIDQDFKDWELLVIDDGSDDKDLLIKKLEKFDDARIKYRRIEHTGNISRVRNYGNTLANGDIIVVHDSDDVAYPNRISEIVKAFEDETVDVVYHGMLVKTIDNENETVSRMIRKADDYDKGRLLKEQYIPGQIAYRSKTIMKYPYDERILVCDDWMMLLGLSLNDCVFKKIDLPLYEYNILEDSVNIVGEEDGRRKQDVETMIKILKEDYDITATAIMHKHTLTANNEVGETISEEIIK